MRTMKTCHRAPPLLCWLVLVFVLLSFLLLLCPSSEEGRAYFSGLKSVPRRMLASAGHKPGDQGAWKNLKTSLRKAPRSGSNPTQNNRLVISEVFLKRR
ncbi:hypothetical protein SAY87_013640 [Trapa incisa]|uniref:Uncharacterized protein n=1 Tax=Trapa incisa TaxID=236973 RepID=A0AAN7KDS7_9MYRT|nr:hypothetical protein SAY87_013640 [Trapa incisa]